MRRAREARVKAGRYESGGGNFYPQPLLIPHMAEDFFREDGNGWEIGMRDTDIRTSFMPISIGSILDVLSILRRSPAFNEDVKKWVEDSLGVSISKLDMPKCRNLMRMWWRENEGHFAKRDYAAVKPGAPLGRNLAKPGAYENDPAYQPKPTTSAPVATFPPPKAASSEPDSISYIFVTAISLSILVIAASAFFVRSRKRL